MAAYDRIKVSLTSEDIGRKRFRMFQKATRDMSVYAKIAYGILVSMAVLIPLAAGSQYYPIIGTNSQLSLFKMSAFFLLTGLCALFGSLGIFLGGREMRWHPIMWCALGYGGFTVLSFAFSVDKNLSLFGDYDRFAGVIPTLITIVVLFLALQLIRNNNGMRFFMHLFVLTSLALAGYGLAQSFGIETAHFANANIMGRRSFSLYGNPNLYAGYLCFAVFFSAGLLFSEKKKGWRAVYWAALLLNVAVTLTSMTRSVWLALVVACPLFVLFLFRQKISAEQSDKFILGGGVLAVLAFIAATFTRKTADLNIATRLTSMFSSEGSSGTRIEMWKSALTVIKEYPLFGAGPDTFEITGMSHLTQRYLNLVGLGEIPNNAHCLPLQLAATIGIIGMLAYYAVGAYAVVVAWKYAWSNDDAAQAGSKIVYAAVLCAVIAFSVNCLVSIASIGVVPFYWIALGYLVAPRAKSKTLKSDAVAVAPLIVALPLALLCIVVPLRFIQADHYFWLAMAETQASKEQVDLYQKALETNPYESDYAVEYVDSLGGNYVARVQSLTSADVQRLLMNVDEFHRKYPNRVDMQSVASYYYTAMAMVLQTDDLYRDAIELDTDILSRFPAQLKVMGDLASLYKATGETEKANELINYIKETGPNTTIKSETLKLYDSVKVNPQ